MKKLVQVVMETETKELSLGKKKNKMEKIIGKYKIKFSGDFSEKTDKLSLNINIDEGLRVFLKGCIAPMSGNQKVSIDMGDSDRSSNEMVEFKRYLIKTPISSAINYIGYFEVPFITSLIDNGKLSLEFNTFSVRDRFKNDFKSVIKKLLEITNNEKVDETVTFNIKQ